MKRLLLSLLIPFLVLSLNTGAVAAKSAATDATEHIFQVDGLTCSLCVSKVEKKFQKMAGVRSVDVSLRYKTVTVYTDRGVCFSKKKLKNLFTKIGFKYRGTSTQPKSCK